MTGVIVDSKVKGIKTTHKRKNDEESNSLEDPKALVVHFERTENSWFKNEEVDYVDAVQRNDCEQGRTQATMLIILTQRQGQFEYPQSDDRWVKQKKLKISSEHTRASFKPVEGVDYRFSWMLAEKRITLRASSMPKDEHPNNETQESANSQETRPVMIQVDRFETMYVVISIPLKKAQNGSTQKTDKQTVNLCVSATSTGNDIEAPPERYEA